MGDKCEWKDDIPKDCKKEFENIISDIESAIYSIPPDTVEILENSLKCIKRFIQKPEEKPLIVKDGETYVYFENGINYLCIDPGEYIDPVASQFRMTDVYKDDWKSFTGENPDITELTDEIAKLRSMVIVSNNPSVLEMIDMLIYVYPGAGIDNAYRYTTTGTTWANCRLATAHELQESNNE